jgi:hypothetical protein
VLRAHQPARHADKKDGLLRQGKGQPVSVFDGALFRSLLPHSLPWPREDLRLVEATKQEVRVRICLILLTQVWLLTMFQVMTEVIWEQIKPEISDGHKKVLMSVGQQERDVTRYFIADLRYSRELLCGIITVAIPGSARDFRKDVFTHLSLSVRVRAMLCDDERQPLISTFIHDANYLEYRPDEVLEV